MWLDMDSIWYNFTPRYLTDWLYFDIRIHNLMSTPWVLSNIFICSIVNGLVTLGYKGPTNIRPLNFESLYLGNEEVLRPQISRFSIFFPYFTSIKQPCPVLFYRLQLSCRLGVLGSIASESESEFNSIYLTVNWQGDLKRCRGDHSMSWHGITHIPCLLTDTFPDFTNKSQVQNGQN